jgi:hypothetical protein
MHINTEEKKDKNAQNIPIPDNPDIVDYISQSIFQISINNTDLLNKKRNLHLKYTFI